MYRYIFVQIFFRIWNICWSFSVIIGRYWLLVAYQDNIFFFLEWLLSIDNSFTSRTLSLPNCVAIVNRFTNSFWCSILFVTNSKVIITYRIGSVDVLLVLTARDSSRISFHLPQSPVHLVHLEFERLSRLLICGSRVRAVIETFNLILVAHTISAHAARVVPAQRIIAQRSAAQRYS